MDSEKKSLIICTTLSNVDINQYDEDGITYNNEIICKYSKANNHQMINNVFSQFIDTVYFANKYSSLSELTEYTSNNPFYVRYNITLSLNELGDSIFNCCQTLSSVINIGNNFKRIGKYAFNDCSELQYLNIPSSIREIDSFAFNGTYKLHSLDVLNVTTLHNYSFAGSGIEHIELNPLIKTLNHYLFKDCKNLKTFENSNINNIGEGVFCGCSNLEYVQISDIDKTHSGTDEYKEEPEETPTSFISKEYKVSIFITLDPEEGPIKIGDLLIATIENLIKDGDLSELTKFKVLEIIKSVDEYSEYLPSIGDSFYVAEGLYEDEDHIMFIYYDEGGNEMETKITLFVEDKPIETETESETESETEVEIPVTRWELYDNTQSLIGEISEELADKIKSYRDENDEPIVEATDMGNGTEVIVFKNPIEIHEYYNDGITPTGKIFNSFRDIKQYDDDQLISKYVKANNGILEDEDDINQQLVFSDDFAFIKIKLNGFPVYDPTETYIIYTIYKPFLSIRIQYDTNLKPIASKNNQAYIDLGFYETEDHKWPVYNINYCFLGIMTNEDKLFYTNQSELDKYLSRLNSKEIYDENGYPTGWMYFMLPDSNNFNEYSLSTEEGRQYVIETITNMILSILASSTEEENNIYESLTIKYDVNENNEIQLYHIYNEEEEETNNLYNKFNIHDLEYKNSKIELSNYLFAGCVKLSNDNIVRIGNLNIDNSNSIITFKNIPINGGKYYKGIWKDIINFNYYIPNTVEYEYEFKWTVIRTINNYQYLKLILNDNIYYILESFDENLSKYIYTLSNHMYNKGTISDSFNIPDNVLNEHNINLSLVSLFTVIPFNTQISIKLNGYLTSIYDKYPFLDIIGSIGKGTFMNCSSIKEIYNQFTSIDEFGFKDCINLKYIDLSKTTKIGNYAFMNCRSLKNIDLKKLGTNLAEGIFYNCENLETVDNLELNYVPRYLFKNCYKLNNIDITNVIEFSNESFYNCQSLVLEEQDLENQEVKANNINSASIIGDYAFCNCKNIKALTFKPTIRSIGKGAFRGCTGLENVVLPNTIKEFSPEMFYGCVNLKSIEFKSPYISTKLDGSFELTALDYCNNLSNIKIEEGGKFTTTDANNCIIDKVNQELLYVCKDIQLFKLTKDIIKINPYAFNNSKVSIIEIEPECEIENLSSNLFANIKNKNYHILIDRKDGKNDAQYFRYLEVVGKKHIYYK